MEIDVITGYKRNQNDGSQESHLIREPDNLFFMDPDHKEVRISEAPEVQDYWEAGLMMESLNALKTGRADHSQIMCYHCSYRGHMKANCPDRRRSNNQPWDRRWKPEVRKTFVRKGHNTGGGSGWRFARKDTSPRKWHEDRRAERPRNLQQMEEDFQ